MEGNAPAEREKERENRVLPFLGGKKKKRGKGHFKMMVEGGGETKSVEEGEKKKVNLHCGGKA